MNYWAKMVPLGQALACLKSALKVPITRQNALGNHF